MTKLNLIIGEGTTHSSLYFRFEDRIVLSNCELSVDNKEAKPRVLKLCNRVEEYYPSVGSSSHFFSCDCDISWLGSVWVSQGLGESLVTRSDNLVKGKLVSSNEVVTGQVLRLIVVAVIDFDLVSIILLEVEINSHFLDEFGVQVVIDSLGLSKFLPHIPSFLEENYKGI